MDLYYEEDLLFDSNISESSQYLKDIAGIAVLSDKEFDKLFVAFKNGDKSARDKIIVHNLRLVVTVVKKFMTPESSLPFMDLVMEGNLGLYKAIDNFDPNKGYKFSTYAWQWIHQAVISYVYNKSTTIRIPVNVNNNLARYKTCINQWQQETHTESLPPKSYVMEHIPTLTEESYKAVCRAYKCASVDSLNKVTSTEIDESDELIEFIEDDSPDMISNVENEELAKVLDETIERFIEKNVYTPDRTRDILYRCFGLHGYEEQKLVDIGEYYGITGERVRQIQGRFIKFCRNGHAMSILKRYR